MEFPRSFPINTDYRDRKTSLNWECRLFAHVALIDKTPPTVPPLLYQLKEGSFPLDISDFPDKAKFPSDWLVLVGEVAFIDKKKKQIILTNKNVLSYDHLIIATGSKQGEGSAEEQFTTGLYALFDALKMQSTVVPSMSSIPERQCSKYSACPAGDSNHVAHQVVHPRIDISKKSVAVGDLQSTRKRVYEVQL